MSCEHLICAQCSAPVSEGRCPTCRAARDEMHPHSHFTTSQQLLIAAALVLTLLVVVIMTHVAG